MVKKDHGRQSHGEKVGNLPMIESQSEKNPYKYL